MLELICKNVELLKVEVYEWSNAEKLKKILRSLSTHQEIKINDL